MRVNTVKFRKLKPRDLYFSKALFEGVIFGGAYIWRGLSTEGNLCFKIDWASLIVGSKFTVFALFYFVFEGNFPSTSPHGGLYLEGRFNGGAYFRNFTVCFYLMGRSPNISIFLSCKERFFTCREKIATS